jgi:hypothetical protein
MLPTVTRHLKSHREHISAIIQSNSGVKHCSLYFVVHTFRKQIRYEAAIHISQLTRYSSALLKKPPVPQLLKNFPKIYGTRTFITVFRRARSIQSIAPHATSLRSILILSTHLRLGLPNGLFPSEFSTKTLYAFLFSPSFYMPCPSHSP